MRKITPAQIGTFGTLATVITVGALASSALLSRLLPAGDFRGCITLIGFVVLFYLWAFAVYRLFLRWMPLQVGELAPGSRGEFAAQVNTLFYLLMFYPLTRTHFVPTPLMRLVYLALGARLGDNTYSGGALLDPPLTVAGRNCIIGHGAVVFAHAIEGDRFSLGHVRLGDDVTIGAMAIVMSDVEIGDGAIVSAGALVRKGTRIPAGETWGGVPARSLRKADAG